MTRLTLPADGDEAARTVGERQQPLAVGEAMATVSPRRTFARVQPTTKGRVDLGLRLAGVRPGGRLQPSKIHETMPLQISFTAVEELDAEALDWLQQAYAQNV